MNKPYGNPAGPGNGPGESPQGNPDQAEAAGQYGPPPGGQHYYYGGPWVGGHPDPSMQQPWNGMPGYAAPPYPPPPPYGYYAAPGVQPPPPPGGVDQAGLEAAFNEMADKNGFGMLKGMFNFSDGEFWKGALVGAAIVMIMTNDELRNSLINGAAKTAEAVKSGFSGSANGDESDEDTSPEDIDEESEA